MGSAYMQWEECGEETSGRRPILKEGYYLFKADDGETFYVPQDAVDLNSTEPIQILQTSDEGSITITLHLRRHGDTFNEVEEAVGLDLNETEPLQYSEEGHHRYEQTEEDNDIEDFEVKTKWTDSATKFLMSLYAEKKKLVENRKIPTYKKMWEKISGMLREKGYNYTTIQCINKWKTLERGFKRTIDNNKKTGRSRQNCLYESELTEIFVKRTNVFPPTLMGTGSEITKAQQMENAGIERPSSETSSSSTADGQAATKPQSSAVQPKRSRKNVLHDIRLLRTEAAERHTARAAEKKTTSDRLLKLMEERNMEYKRRNDLLEMLLKSTSDE